MTNLTHGGNFLEQSEVGISSLIDTWLLLRDIELGGKRKRGMYILKSRGMAHSNQIRGFLLTDHLDHTATAVPIIEPVAAGSAVWLVGRSITPPTGLMPSPSDPVE